MKLRKTRRRGKILWEVDTQSAGQRARRFFASRPEAQAFMGRQMVLDSSLELAQDWQQIPAADLPDLVRAHRLARQANCRVLDLVKAQLQKGRPITAGSMTLGDAIQQCLEAKRSANCREEYVKNLGLVLRQFAQGREAMPLAQITLEDIEEFMAQGRTVMSRATYLNRLGTLFSFAVRRDWRHWPKDVLRHSCASYLLALKRDAQAVALELGNSPTILFKHYRELVSQEQARRFWNLIPRSERHAQPTIH